jgi:Skp family chaperone for outer membrane proteins
MDEKILDEVMQNLDVLKDRIVGSQDFEISVKYFNNDNELIVEKASRIKFTEIIENLKSEELWTLVAQNLENYFSAHQRSLIDMKDDMEKLLIEMDKLVPEEAKKLEEPLQEQMLTEEAEQKIPEQQQLGQQQFSEGMQTGEGAEEEPEDTEEKEFEKFQD